MSWREYLNVGQLFLGNKSVPVKSYDVEFTVGAEAADVINVAIQLNDPEGKALSEVGVCDFYLADDAAGLTPSTVAPAGGIAIGTDGALVAYQLPGCVRECDQVDAAVIEEPLVFISQQQLDETRVEKGGARLERMGHRQPVHERQHLVGEEAAELGLKDNPQAAYDRQPRRKRKGRKGP